MDTNEQVAKNLRIEGATRVDLSFLHEFYLQTLNKYATTHVENVLIHPTLVSNLVRNAKIEWPDVDLI